MRIVHVDSARGWRGGQNQVWLAATGMASLGHDVTVVCAAGEPLEQRCRESDLNVLTVRYTGDLSLGAAWAMARRFRERPPDVVQLHDPHAVSAGVMAARLSVSRAALIATRRVDFAVRGGLSRLKYRACSRVIAVSRAIADVLGRGGLGSDRVRLVYEGVPDRPAAPGGRDALRQLGIPDGALVIGNVAALVDHKDHHTLLEAFARVAAVRPEARLVIVGDGPLRASLESRAASLGIAGRVVFAGFRSDLDRLIPAFDVFCLSSHMEGLGTSLLDAMCFSRPIVGTAAGGIPEAVAHDESGLVVPVRDAQALGEALERLLAEPQTRERMARAGRARFERMFTAARMVENSVGVYREALP